MGQGRGQPSTAGWAPRGRENWDTAKDRPGSRDHASLPCKLWQEQKGDVTYSGDLKSIAKTSQQSRAPRLFYRLHRSAQQTLGSERMVPASRAEHHSELD